MALFFSGALSGRHDFSYAPGRCRGDEDRFFGIAFSRMGKYKSF